MHSALTPFSEALAEARGQLQAATDHDVLHSRFTYYQGFLRGYFCAGAVSRVEIRAALEQLGAHYHERFMATNPKPRRTKAAVEPCAN